jgi:hypothetical protein
MSIKRLFFYLSLLISPFLLMVVVNEATKTKAYTVLKFGKEVSALNTEDSLPSKCTWHCHNDGCSHHNNNVISLGPIDTLRSMIIESLGVSNIDTYQTNNVLFLVILWPLLMFGLVVANVEMFIRNRKKNAWRNWLHIFMFIARISALPVQI